jgi:LPS export ABC transporter protein LptC
MARPEARAVAAFAIVAGSLLCACRLDYGMGAASGAEALPTARFVDYSHTVVVRGARNLELRAARADAYDADKKVVLVEVEFSEYDPDTGERVSWGTADRAVFFTETEDAEFSGSVRLESKRQDAVLEGEYLRWDKKAKRLEGRLDRTVTVTRGDGSMISGAGFEADARRKSFSYRGSVEGRIVDKDKEKPQPAVEGGGGP